MFIIVLLALLVIAVLTLLSLLKDRKSCNIAKTKIKELTSYTAEHIQALELDGISIVDDLEVQKAKVQKLKKKIIVKTVVFVIFAIAFYIVL